MARGLFLLGALLQAALASWAQMQMPDINSLMRDLQLNMSMEDANGFPQFGMSSRYSTQEPYDLYGPYPAAELVVNKSSWGLDQLAPPTQKWWTNHTRFLPAPATVLAYVTPWNQPAGRTNAEMYRGKLDYVAPVWYTVAPRPVDVMSTEDTYPIGGGFPTDEDRGWMKRMQAPSEAPDGQQLPPVQIVPRFLLENWLGSDDTALLRPERASKLARAILHVVKQEGFDGVVLECSAAWRAPEGIAMVGDAFQKAGKTLVVVFPPFQSNEDAVTSVLARAVQVVTPHVDLVTVMTYDHAGAAGAPVDLDKYNVSAESPLRTDADAELRQRMRVPAPNQPRAFAELNLQALLGPAPAQEQTDDDEEGDEEAGSIDEQIKRMGGVPLSETGAFSEQQQRLRPTKASDAGFDSGLIAAEDAHKVLLGMPLYGYTYPVLWVDPKTGRGQPKVPPAAPPRARQQSSIAASKARAQGERKERGKVPLLRDQGEAMAHADLVGHLVRRPLIYNDPESYEAQFDYIAASRDGLPVPDGHGGTREGVYYRALVPSAYTMLKRREQLAQWPGAGAALWELGQAAPWLLHAL